MSTRNTGFWPAGRRVARVGPCSCFVILGTQMTRALPCRGQIGFCSMVSRSTASGIKRDCDEIVVVISTYIHIHICYVYVSLCAYIYIYIGILFIYVYVKNMPLCSNSRFFFITHQRRPFPNNMSKPSSNTKRILLTSGYRGWTGVLIPERQHPGRSRIQGAMSCTKAIKVHQSKQELVGESHTSHWPCSSNEHRSPNGSSKMLQAPYGRSYDQVCYFWGKLRGLGLVISGTDLGTHFVPHKRRTRILKRSILTPTPIGPKSSRTANLGRSESGLECLTVGGAVPFSLGFQILWRAVFNFCLLLHLNSLRGI